MTNPRRPRFGPSLEPAVELVTSAHLSPDQPTRPVELAPGRLLVSQRLYDRVLAEVPDGERS